LKTIFEPEFLEDLKYWVKENKKIAMKILSLVDHITRGPFSGIGKPEPLKYLGPGVWSRRLTQEHRVVYRVENDFIYFLQGRYHY
jgi:toxin YoeB